MPVKAKAPAGVTAIVITPLNERVLTFTVEGTAPYVQARFSEKAKAKIHGTQEAGSTATKSRKKDPRDFDGDYAGAMHVADEGWLGIPAAAFRCACIDACRGAQFQMVRAKMSIFALADGYDAIDGTPLIRIKGEPRRAEHMVRNSNGSTDIRVRPMWTEWSADVRLRFDADQFTPEDVANLLNRAGAQVGIGEGRALSRASAGMGWGFFAIKKG